MLPQIWTPDPFHTLGNHGAGKNLAGQWHTVSDSNRCL